MSSSNDVINGVPRELLERLEHVTRNLAPHLKCHADLTALLTAQPQASAAQSAPAGEREAFEAAYQQSWGQFDDLRLGINEQGRYRSTRVHEALIMFQAGASWQRTQSPSVPDFSGIGRDASHPRAVVLYLRAEPTDDDLRAIQGALRFAAAPAQPAAQDQGEVLTEHSGCGRGIQVDQLTVRMYPGDKVVMVRGRIGKALAASTGQEVTHDA